MFDFVDFMGGLIATLLCAIVLFLVIMFFGAPFFEWKSSEVEARIYNEKYGTNYTTSDFFWGGSQINTQTQTIKLEQ